MEGEEGPTLTTKTASTTTPFHSVLDTITGTIFFFFKENKFSFIIAPSSPFFMHIIIEDDAGDYRMRQFQPSMSTEERHVLHSTGSYCISNDAIHPSCGR